MNSVFTASRNQFKPEDFVNTAESLTQVPIFFNIIHIHNISKSRLHQLEEWQEYDDPNNVSVDRVSKSNKRKSNKVITQVDIEDGSNIPSTSWSSNDVYKLILRDKFNNYSFAYEYNDKLSFIRHPNEITMDTPLKIPLGGRLIVKKGTLIMNGVLMLNNSQCQYLGIDETDKSLFEQLNSGVVDKYIKILNEELQNSRV